MWRGLHLEMDAGRRTWALTPENIEDIDNIFSRVSFLVQLPKVVFSLCRLLQPAGVHFSQIQGEGGDSAKIFTSKTSFPLVG